MENLNESAPESIKNIFDENELQFLIIVHEGTEYDPKITYRPKLLEFRILETENLEEIKSRSGADIDQVLMKINSLSFDEVAELVEWACNY